MATWNIGIDEKGKFGCFSETEEGPSFVCAFLTRKSGAECEQFLKACAVWIDQQKYKEVTNAVVRENYKNESDYNRKIFENIVANFYHAKTVDGSFG